jgi:N6-adenosine-specific RNA methylase IME4
MPLADISIGKRHRKDLGDLDSLARSLADLGLLQPVAVRPDGRLVAGRRRLAAAARLGWAEIGVTVVRGLDDAVQALTAERDENTCRAPLRPSEMVSLGEELGRLLARRAEQRRRRAGVANLPNASGGKLPPLGAGERGKTRDQVGRAVGVSGRSYEKARALVAAARADPGKYGRLLADMDRTGRVDGVYRRVRALQEAEAQAAAPPPLPAGPFRVLAVDPPWPYRHRPGDHSKRNVTPYPTLTQAEIKALPVARLAARDAVLWLWATNAHLPDAFEVLREWGFSYKTTLTWVKPRIGTGDWLRGRTEHCLMAVRGRPVVTLGAQSTALHAPARGHSLKPDEFYELVESLCPGSKVELFATRRRPGWVAWGLQVEAAGAGSPGGASPSRRR